MVTTDNAEIRRIIRDYYEQLYANKMDNREQMDRFLVKFNLPRLKKEEIETVNKSFIGTEIKTVIKKKKKRSKNRSPGPDDLKVEFYQIFREELMYILLKLFQKFTWEERLPNSFYQAIYTLLSKSDKGITHTKNNK